MKNAMSCESASRRRGIVSRMRDADRPKHFVETPRERPRRALHVQAQAMIADMQGRLKRFVERN